MPIVLINHEYLVLLGSIVECDCVDERDSPRANFMD